MSYTSAVYSYPDSKVHGANMGPSGADRTQVGPMLASWTLISGYLELDFRFQELSFDVTIYILETIHQHIFARIILFDPVTESNGEHR